MWENDKNLWYIKEDKKKASEPGQRARKILGEQFPLQTVLD